MIAGFSLQYGAGGPCWTSSASCFWRPVCAGSFRPVHFQHSEPVPPGDDHRRVSLGEFIWRVYVSGEGRVLVYLLLVQTAAQICGPYFTPYMLREPELSYVKYVALVAMAFGAKVIALPAMGAIAHRWGARRLLAWGGVAIVPLSSFWIVSDNFYYLSVPGHGGRGLGRLRIGNVPAVLRDDAGRRTDQLAHDLQSCPFGATAIGSLMGGAILLSWGPTRNVYWALFAFFGHWPGVQFVGAEPGAEVLGLRRAGIDAHAQCAGRRRFLGSTDLAQPGCRT